MVVFGTRPEAIKLVPVIKELENTPGVEPVVCVTGQHRELLYEVLESFNINPSFNLNVMEGNQTLAGLSEKILNGLQEVFLKERPDLVLVHGDTTTTFITSLTAFYNDIPIGHIEAGLRTHDITSPFPEEANRQLTGVLADLHFSPTEHTKSNLLWEGKPGSKVFVTGNTAIDTLKLTVGDTQVEGKPKGRTILFTAHRRENHGENIVNMLNALKDILREFEDVDVLFPVHPNPNVRYKVMEMLRDEPRIKLVEPLGVRELHTAMKYCHLVLTDSGGIQEEAPALDKPVIVMRDKTERVEGVEAGTLKLAGTTRDGIYQATKLLLESEDEYNHMASKDNPYGDGTASKQIVQIIVKELED